MTARSVHTVLVLATTQTREVTWTYQAILHMRSRRARRTLISYADNILSNLVSTTTTRPSERINSHLHIPDTISRGPPYPVVRVRHQVQHLTPCPYPISSVSFVQSQLQSPHLHSAGNAHVGAGIPACLVMYAVHLARLDHARGEEHASRRFAPQRNEWELGSIMEPN